MARNKYPERTVQRILEVSKKLFLEKGYENTTIQDILDELKDLTKGAIYHHFSSKEAIFDAIASNEGKIQLEYFLNIKNDNSLTGEQKLKKFINCSISSTSMKKFIKIAPNLLDNPKFLAIQLKQIRDVITPSFILPIIQEGIEDKSIITNKPYELSELIAVLLNIWINPIILGEDSSKITNKCLIINEILELYNINLFDFENINEILKLSE